jgi:hypothetical protein
MPQTGAERHKLFQNPMPGAIGNDIGAVLFKHL